MVETGETVNAVLWLVVATLALVTFLIFYISYKRVRDKRILITTGAFFIFFVKAMLLGMRLFISESAEENWFLNDEFWLSVAAILDVIIIGLIVYSLSKRANGS